jgi:glycosyltransferase involved in cell wall biosynthesis
MTAGEVTIEQLLRPREPLHLLTLTPFYPVNGDDGQGCFVEEPLEWLGKLGVVNTVRAVQPFYRGGSSGPAASAVPARWIRYLSFPGGYGLSSAGAFLFAALLPEIRRLHAARPIHIIHAHSALPCGHAALLLSRELKLPFVVTVHGLDAFFSRQVKGRAGDWCTRISQSVYRSACAVIGVSEKVRKQVVEGVVGLDNTTVIYNGVDVQVFSPTHSFDEGEPKSATILSVGNLIPTKGHELLVRAFASIHDRFPALSLEIIGDGPERTRLQHLALQLGVAAKVFFPGRRSRAQVAEAMRLASIFALPSRYEGLGCVYLEAMAAGKPVIACRGQGIDEVIEDGINGSLTDVNDLQELTDTLVRLLQDSALRQKMGNRARQTVVAGYTLAEQANQLVHIYRECRQ